MENGFLWGNQKKVCPARNEMAFTVLRLYGFPSTDFSGFCVKHVSTWLTVLPAPCFQVRLEVFFSFLHAKVGRERLVYFIVSYHIVLNLYFIKWLGLNLRRTKFDLLVTLFTFKDIDNIFWWPFCTFRKSTCHQLLIWISLDSVARVLFPSMLNKRKEKLKFLRWACFSSTEKIAGQISTRAGVIVRFTPRDVK